MNEHYFDNLQPEVDGIMREYRLDGLGSHDFYQLVLKQKERLDEIREGTGRDPDVYIKGRTSDYVLREIGNLPKGLSKDELFHQMDVALVLYNGGNVDDFLHTTRKQCPVDNYTYDLLSGIGYEPFRMVDMGKDKAPVLPFMSYQGERSDDAYGTDLSGFSQELFDNDNYRGIVADAFTAYISDINDVLPDDSYKVSRAVISARFVGDNNELARSYFTNLAVKDYQENGMTKELQDDLRAACVFMNCSIDSLAEHDFEGMVSSFMEVDNKELPVTEKAYYEFAKCHDLIGSIPYHQSEEAVFDSDRRISQSDINEVRYRRAQEDFYETNLNQYDGIMENVFKELAHYADDDMTYDTEELKDIITDETQARLDRILDFGSDAGKRRLYEVFDELKLTTDQLPPGESYLYEDLQEQLSEYGYDEFASRDERANLYVADKDLPYYPGAQDGMAKELAGIKPVTTELETWIGDRVVDDGNIRYDEGSYQPEL